MANYKVRTRGDFTTVTYKQKEPLQVNQREMGLLDINQMPGFMKPRQDTANEMSYLAPSCISLKKYLTKDCSIDKVYNVVERIIGAINQVSGNQMFMQNLLLDSKYIFARELSGELFFIYEPYLKNARQVDLLLFFMTIISMAKIKDKGQKMQLEQFRQFVSSHGRLEDVDSYVKQMQHKQNGQGGFTGHFGFQNPPSGTMGMQFGFDEMEDEGTSVLGYEDEGTTILDAQQELEPETTVLRREPVVTLIRTKDGNSVQLSGAECTIGRAADNYVAIRDNTDVSRYHAVITMGNGVYAVIDRGSKNGTVVNGNNLMPNNPASIQNGDVIVFGGEEFTFVVEK